MNILLINPNPCGQPDIGINVSPVPLGLLYIAAALKRAGYGRVCIMDANNQALSQAESLARIRNYSPDLVGITSMSTGAGAAHDMAALVKTANAGCKVVLGGPYSCTTPESILKDQNIDFVVIGEGERTICELIEALQRDRDISGIAGLGFRKNGVPFFNPGRPPIEDIDSIPFPAWDLLDMETYFDSVRRHSFSQVPVSRRMVPIFTSRGCPFGCIYCHNIFGKHVRLRSVESVLREIELLIEKHMPQEIEIWDDIFNYDIDRAKRICAGIIKRGIKVNLSFPNGLRVDRMDKELVAMLKEAGTRVIFYAIESASAEVQKRISKNLDLKKAREIIRFTTELGIFTGGFFMLGFPEETREEMQKTIQFAKEEPFHIVVFNYLTPRPNTPVYEQTKSKHPDSKDAPLYHYTKFSVNLSSESDATLRQMWARAYAGFYLRPAQLWRIWKALPNKWNALKYFPKIFRFSIPWHF